MTRWLAAVVVLMAAGAAMAETTPLGDGLPRPGMALEEARALPLAGGQRLLCTGDPDLPRLANKRVLDPAPAARGSRIRRCSVFAEAADGAWAQSPVATNVGATRLAMVFVASGGADRFRLAQLILWPEREAWDATTALLTRAFGPATTRAVGLNGWKTGSTETVMFVDAKHGGQFGLFVSDLRLRSLLRSRGGQARQEGAP